MRQNNNFSLSFIQFCLRGWVAIVLGTFFLGSWFTLLTILVNKLGLFGGGLICSFLLGIALLNICFFLYVDMLNNLQKPILGFSLLAIWGMLLVFLIILGVKIVAITWLSLISFIVEIYWVKEKRPDWIIKAKASFNYVYWLLLSIFDDWVKPILLILATFGGITLVMAFPLSMLTVAFPTYQTSIWIIGAILICCLAGISLAKMWYTNELYLRFRLRSPYYRSIYYGQGRDWGSSSDGYYDSSCSNDDGGSSWGSDGGSYGGGDYDGGSCGGGSDGGGSCGSGDSGGGDF